MLQIQGPRGSKGSKGVPVRYYILTQLKSNLFSLTRAIKLLLPPQVDRHLH